MTWYNPITWFKANPAQSVIALQEGSMISTDASINYLNAFDKLESVNRGVNMIASACAGLDYDIKDKVSDGSSAKGTRVKTLRTLLNYSPNPYQSVQEFRTHIFSDFLLEGNAFIYYDGAHLYHLPAVSVEVHPDTKTFVAGYTYNSATKFLPTEIAHFKDISSKSIYRGTSRLKAADRNIKILFKMQQFQENYFENGAVFGMVLTSDNTLSKPAKDRTIETWVQRYNPKLGGRRPLILDSGLKPYPLSTATFKDMDFDVSIKTHNVKILETLGVPPVLLDGGNQANISPNLRLFYLETVMPIVRKYVSAMEAMFGYDIDAVTSNVSALQPELKDVAAYYTSLVNGGIITADEARVELRYDAMKSDDSDKLRIPANIAGSAANPDVGGAPKKPEPK